MLILFWDCAYCGIKQTRNDINVLILGTGKRRWRCKTEEVILKTLWFWTLLKVRINSKGNPSLPIQIIPQGNELMTGVCRNTYIINKNGMTEIEYHFTTPNKIII